MIVLTTLGARQRYNTFGPELPDDPCVAFTFQRGEGRCRHGPREVLLEGDNTGEATDLALYLNRWKKLFPVAAGKNPPLDYPVSWEHLFGNPVPASIY